MRIAYFDCLSGVSGDMVLGALLDAGLPLDALETELAKLPVRDYTLEARKVTRQGIAGTQVIVLEHRATSSVGSGRINAHGNGHGGTAPGPGRDASGLLELVESSALADVVKEKAVGAIRRIATAEGRVHGVDPGQVHLHELSGVDTLVDIVGAMVGLHLLGVERVECSPLNVGGGFVKSSHGLLPVPAPATAEILRSASAPLYGTEVTRELVTPTGAAIIATLAASYGPMPAITVDKLGYGAGAADTPGHPNLLRLTIGNLAARPGFHPAAIPPMTHLQAQHSFRNARLLSPDEELVTLIETNLDDMNPQYYDFVMERLLGQGALDVFLVPVQMKKNRPGVVLSVLCRPEDADLMAATIFEETTTLGVRVSDVPRRTLQRDIVEVHTHFGPIKVKVARNSEGKVLHVKPEYEDVKRVALELNLPIDKVYEEARQAWTPHLSDGHQRIGRHRSLPIGAAKEEQ